MSSQRPVIAYRRVSTQDQGESGLGLDSQRAVIDAEAMRRGWDDVTHFVDVASGKSTNRRPQLSAALAALGTGRAGVLVVSKLDRLSRSLLDFAAIMAQAQREGWSIVALDIGVDTATINGELVANIIMSLAQWERRIIGQRTKDALGVVKGRGVKLGRPTTVTRDAVAIVAAMRGAGSSLRDVADALNRASVPTAQGGARWYASTVRAVEQRMGQGAPPERTKAPPDSEEPRGVRPSSSKEQASD